MSPGKYPPQWTPPHSRQAGPSYAFFAFPGARADGRQFAADAMARGAVAIVSELAAPEGFEGPWVQVEHGRRALAVAARNFYGKPDERLGLTGITGTNGKTTTAYLADSVMRAAGHITAMIGTTSAHSRRLRSGRSAFFSVTAP